MAQGNWEADKMLDVYIYDYLTKRNLSNSAKAFLAEGKVSSDPVAIDAPGGFLYEWWSVFWDIFIARTNEKHSEVAANYIETQQLKAREMHQMSQNHQQQQQQQHHQQLQMQQMQMLRQQQLQNQIQNQPRNSVDPLLRQSTPTANLMATKIYEDKLKHDESNMKRYGDSPALDPNAMKAAAAAASVPGQPSGPGGNVNNSIPGTRPQQQTLQDNKSDVQLINQKSPATSGDPAMFNVKSNVLNPGPSQVSQKNWSLAGMDQQRLLQQQQQQKPYLNSSPAYQQMHPLSQHQQNLLFQQNEMDAARRFRVLVRGKDGFNDPASGLGSPPLQAASPLSRAPSQDQADLLYKMKIAQMQQPNKLLVQQNIPQPQGVDGTMSSYRSGDHIYSAIEPSPSNNSTGTAKAKGGRKRKQPASSSGPANSTGTANTAGRSPNSPSTPSTHTPGDAVGAHQRMIYSSEHGTLASSSNQLAEIDRLGEDGSLDDNVESFLTQEEADPRVDVTKASKTGFTFSEVVCLRGTTNKVVCCHFSSDGKLLAGAGHEKKAILWNMDTFKLHSTLEEHSFLITDVRFSPNSTRLATSSFDKAVRVWDADNPSYSFRTFTGHQTSVMSLDFHPTNEDLLCSCDGDSEIRYWSVNQGNCTRVFKGGMTQTRFQPRHGRLLAAAADNVVSIFDVESETCRHSLQRHTKPVHSVCWDTSGDFLASVSEDSVRVWALRGNDGECIYELSSHGNKFHSCVFHPSYPSVLVIGCYESLELWNMSEKKSMTIPAHSGLIAALASSPATGMVASASHDKTVKLWK